MAQVEDEGQAPSGGDWQREYWRRNLRLVLILLAIWFLVPFCGGILFVEQLNQISLGPYPLGFWIAQQGSIYVFLVLILIYAVRMDKLDDKFGVSERDGEGNRR